MLRSLAARRSRVASGRSAASSQVSAALPVHSNPAQGSQTSRRAVLGTGLVLGLGMSSTRSVEAASAAKAGSEIEKVLEDPRWPAKWPFRPADFQRYDEQADGVFYSQPRFVTHIDDPAIAALTKFYGKVFPPSGTEGAALLDICSSWVSHYPEGYKAPKVVGLGMNGDELKRNTQLTDWTVKDLNSDPVLPYADGTFDVVTNCVSVDYLNKPLKVFREMHRVLKPGGTAYMSFSNRCFPTKAIQLWTATGDADHVWIVGSYFHYSVEGGWEAPKCADISPNPGRSDPMYVVYASKKA